MHTSLAHLTQRKKTAKAGGGFSNSKQSKQNDSEIDDLEANPLLGVVVVLAAAGVGGGAAVRYLQ